MWEPPTLDQMAMAERKPKSNKPKEIPRRIVKPGQCDACFEMCPVDEEHLMKELGKLSNRKLQQYIMELQKRNAGRSKIERMETILKYRKANGIDVKEPILPPMDGYTRTRNAVINAYTRIGEYPAFWSIYGRTTPEQCQDLFTKYMNKLDLSLQKAQVNLKLETAQRNPVQ